MRSNIEWSHAGGPAHSRSQSSSTVPLAVAITLSGCTSPWLTTRSSVSPATMALDRRHDPGTCRRVERAGRPPTAACRNPTTGTTRTAGVGSRRGRSPGSRACTRATIRPTSAQSASAPDGTNRCHAVTATSPSTTTSVTRRLGHPDPCLGQHGGQRQRRLRRGRRTTHPQHHVPGDERRVHADPHELGRRQPPHLAPPAPPPGSTSSIGPGGRSTNGRSAIRGIEDVDAGVQPAGRVEARP